MARPEGSQPGEKKTKAPIRRRPRDKNRPDDPKVVEKTLKKFNDQSDYEKRRRGQSSEALENAQYDDYMRQAEEERVIRGDRDYLLDI